MCKINENKINNRIIAQYLYLDSIKCCFSDKIYGDEIEVTYHIVWSIYKRLVQALQSAIIWHIDALLLQYIPIL